MISTWRKCVCVCVGVGGGGSVEGKGGGTTPASPAMA